MEPKVSIVVPCYNVELYIGECMESILGQDYKNLEVICIDDFSTDATYNRILEFCNRDSRVKLLKHSKNKGLSIVRNNGIKEATGEYIWFIDADDYIKENAVKKIVNQLLEMDAEGIFFYFEKKNQGTRTSESCIETVETRLPCKENHLYIGKDIFRKFYECRSFKIEACRYMWKLEFLRNNSLFFYERLIHEDNYFTFFALMKAKKILVLQEALYVYRIRDDSIMANIDQRYLQSIYIILVDIISYWRKNGDDEQINKAIEYYLDSLWKIFLKRRNYFEEIEELRYGTKADQHIYEKLVKLKISLPFRYVHFSKEDVNKLQNAKKVVVYGAGVVGSEVIELLEAIDISISAIAVSLKKLNEDYFMNYKVYAIDELVNDRQIALVVIAVVEKKQRAIESKLNELGFHNRVYVK